MMIVCVSASCVASGLSLFLASFLPSFLPSFLAPAGAVMETAGDVVPTNAGKIRLDDLRARSGPKLAERLRATPPEELIALGREGVRALGSYRTRVTKLERVGGKLLPAQTIEVAVRAAPHALRLEYLAGPSSGRRVAWREGHRPAEMLVREGGILGITSLWIDVDGKLAHKDTNHRVMELGFGPALEMFDRDLRLGRAQGGHTRRDRGFDDRGRYCIEYAAPAGAKGLYAERSDICIDPKLGVPVRIEVFDRHGLLERYEYSDVRPNQTLAPSLFDEV